jgi:hypothetical protein
MEAHSIASFEDLHNMVRTNSHDHFIFRGEDDAGYRLQPKYGRHNSSIRQDALSIERRCLMSSSVAVPRTSRTCQQAIGNGLQLINISASNAASRLD